ncbi:MAG TPA: alpha/beta hydrolase [Actinopolymorphaceae bacterium]|nr:alpha/beta hydrolase [Actinopolymorphaceae bacterium]
MPNAVVDGIPTRYEVAGSGSPLLMFSPGGFDARLENWSSLGLYRRLNLLAHLTSRFTCIAFDRRESGRSGGRVERVGWSDYVAQGKGLLEHLDIGRAHLMGGCVGCSAAALFGVTHPEAVLSMVLFSPAGGPRYRLRQHARFASHAAFVESHGLAAVVDLARSHDQGFAQDACVGPWVSVIRRDESFADAYERRDRDDYLLMVGAMSRTLFDRDTVPGPEPEDLLRLDIPALVVPGQDASHATSAARYLEECLPRAEYWDVPVAEQTEQTAPARVLRFLDAVGSG